MERKSPAQDRPANEPKGPAPENPFLRKLMDSQLLSAEKVQALRAQMATTLRNDSRHLADAFVRHGLLTHFQARQLLSGKAGLRIGNYVILDRLGAGGMGVVFKARHRRMNRIVALKVLSPSALRQSRAALLRFQQEVQAAARLHHPHIVTAFDADEVRGISFLAMEYVEGADLGRLVEEQGALPIATAVDALIQACRGLEHAHAAGVIHRDVKPSNLLADNQGNLKLLDMGLSRLEDVEDVAGNRKPGTYLLGTCDYMAPEQAADPQAACPRSDIYSLGATLFFLLIGQPMYCGGSGFDRVLAHRQAPPPSLRDARPEVPAGLEAIYRRMVAKQPTDRFATMTEVRQALEGLGLAGGSDLAARVATYRGQPVTPSRPISTSGESLGATGPSRQGWLLALLLAIVLGLLSWAVVISLSTPRS